MVMDTLKTQVDGSHYKGLGIQPWEIITANNLDFYEGTILSYLLRWRNKDGIVDLEKSIHYLQHMIELAKQGHYGTQWMPKEKHDNG